MTKCQCWEHGTYTHILPCSRNAVRMVAVPQFTSLVGWIIPPSGSMLVPMCGICADGHEKQEHAPGCRCPECDPDWNDPRNHEPDHHWPPSQAEMDAWERDFDRRFLHGRHGTSQTQS